MSESPMPRATCVVLLLSTLGACAPVVAPDAREDEPPSLDLGAAIELARSGFRALGTGHEASGIAHVARVTGTTLELEPCDLDSEASPSARFRTRSIARGARVVDAPGDAHLERGALVVAHGDVLERLVNRPDGVEQSWRFPSPFEGALRVAIDVEGAGFVAATEHGLHFGRGLEASLRYGRATWIDATGREWDVAPRWTGTEIVIEVPASIIAETRFPATLDPIIGPELAVDEPAYGAVRTEETAPDAAFDGANYLVVWEDRRRSRGTRTEIHGARVTPEGVVLDPSGIVIAPTTSGSRSAPRVASNGAGGWLVVWQVGGTTVQARRVATDGSLLDASPLDVGSGVRPDVTAHAGGYFVAWRAFSSILGARVSLDGALVDSPPRAYLSTGGSAVAAAVASSATEHLLVAQEDESMGGSIRNSWGIRVAFDGSPIGTRVLLARTTATARGLVTDVASDGTSFLIAGVAGTSTAATFQTSIVGSDGMIVTGSSLDIGPSSGGTGTCRASSLGTQYVATCVGFQTNVARVTAAGALMRLDTLARAVPSLTVGTATGALDVYPSQPAGSAVPADIVGARMDAAGDPIGAPIRISGQSADRIEPAVAWNGADWLVAWTDARPGAATDIYAARIRADGTLRDPAAFVIAATSAAERAPRVASDGVGFLVTYLAPDLRAARVDADGSVRDVSGIAITTDVAAHAVASSMPDRYVLALSDSTGAVRTASFDASAGTAFVNAPLAVVTGGAGVDVACEGSQCLVVGASTDVHAARVDVDGAPIGATFLVAGSTRVERMPAITGLGGDFLVVWSAVGTGPTVLATRISPAGVVRDAGIRVGFSASWEPDVAWDGRHAWIVWSTDETVAFFDPGIFARRVDASGALVGDALRITLFETNAGAATVAGGPAGRLLLASERYASEVPWGATTVFARVLENLEAEGIACTAPAECGSGHCVDGVCCDTECGGGAADCQACSIAGGAIVAGRCSLLPSSRTCRAAVGGCDVADLCTGIDPTCPVDARAVDGTSCANSATCDGLESCIAGACTAGTTPSCEDGDACTSDACAEPLGCAHVAVAGCCNTDAACDDLDACTVDVCLGPGGTCAHPRISGCCATTADCADASECTADTCDISTSRCAHDAVPACCAIAADCADGDACTDDACAGTSCSNVRRAGCCLGDGDCDDGDACTRDSCAGPGEECAHAAIAGCCDGDGDCDDGDRCTRDTCDGATLRCASSPIAACCEGAECPDTAMLDGGSSDAGSDGGSDASSLDAAPPLDAGAPPAPTASCGCRAGSGGTMSSLAVTCLLALLSVVRSARRRPSRRCRVARSR